MGAWHGGRAAATVALVAEAEAAVVGVEAEEALQPPVTKAETEDLNANPTPDLKAQQNEAFDELMLRLEATSVDPRADNWATWVWDPREGKFTCP